jgi:hypothetical protein
VGIWKKKGDKRHTDRTVRSTVKFGGGSMMVWACITAKGVGYLTKIDGNLDSELYVRESIMNDEFLDTLEYYEYSKDEIVFQQDNDPKHKSKRAMKWFEDNEIEVLDWPPQSPDLNPIENVWWELKRRLNSYETDPSGMIELWERVQDVWNSIIPPEICLGLIESMPKRIEKC